MKYDKNKLCIKQLPAAVIIKNYIKGHPADYEQYLIEFINSSKLVKDKGNEKFILRKHEEQSQGQSDIYNTVYELDFKILVDTDYMEAKKMLSKSIAEICPGVIVVGDLESKKTESCFDIVKCFRFKSLKELMDIESGILKYPESRSIKKVLNKITVDKNLLLFLPYDYYYKNEESNLEIAEFIVNCIGTDLKGLFEYRKTKLDRDTYIAFVSNNYFIMAKEKDNSLIVYDMIETGKSVLYTYLYNADRL